jgi:hypothetical protein
VGDTGYPKGASFCIDATTLLPVWSTDGNSIYTFTYSPASNVQINPQGAFLRVIQAEFGHYP